VGKYITLCDIRCDRVTSGHVTLGHMKVQKRSAQTRMIVYKLIDQIHENFNKFSLSTLIREQWLYSGSGVSYYISLILEIFIRIQMSEPHTKKI